MVIHIAIAFDAHYLNPCYALLASIMHNHERGSVCIHAIATGIDDSILDRIKKHIHQFGNEIQYYSISDSRLNDFVTMNTWTSAVYYRLYFSSLVQDKVERLIYLDTDTVVLKSLMELNSVSLGGFPVAAVWDNYVRTQPLIGIEKEGEYFNSGVLVIDVNRWRDEKISENAIRYLLDYPERIKFVDQCALNAVLKGKWQKLENKFNLLYSYVPESLSKKELSLFLTDKVIVHFTLQRPWHMLCKSRLRYFYYKYWKMFPGRKKIIIYDDASWNKILAWLKIRMVEFYLDHETIRKIWGARNFTNR